MPNNAPTPNRLAYSIIEFCKLVGVSRAFFYKLPESERPRMTRRGGRWLISAQAAREWIGDNPSFETERDLSIFTYEEISREYQRRMDQFHDKLAKKS